MRKIYLFLILVSILNADSPISKEKEEILRLKRESVKKESEKLKNDWISPLILKGSVQKSKSSVNSFSNSLTTAKNLSLSLNQDIFRSGGIFYAVRYARSLGKSKLLSVDIQEASILKKIYVLKAQIDRDRAKIEQAKLLLKNREIDVLVVKEKYKAGNADIARLNGAVLEEEKAKENLVTLQNALKNELYEIKKLIGDKDEKKISLIPFPLPSKEEYISKNLSLLSLKESSLASKNRLKVTQASYLPKVYVNADFGYSEYESSRFKREGKEYGYGIGFRIPFDYNSENDIEVSRLEYLQKESERKDKIRELEFEYEKRLSNIKSYEEKIKLSDKMISLYKELYDFTKREVEAGFKTELELESLANSLKIEKLQKEIQKYNILIEKANLYFDMQRGEK